MSALKFNLTFGINKFTRMMDVVDDGEKDGKCQIAGVLGGFLQEIIDFIYGGSMAACKIHASDTIGVYDSSTELYDGAVGAMQRNMSDMVLVPQYYPLIDPAEKYFDYSLPFHEDKMMIICAYNSSYKKIEKDIMFMFTTVSYKLWISVFIAYFLFSCLVSMGYRLYGDGKHRSSLWLVTCAFLYEDNFPENNFYYKLVNLIAGIFLFFFGNYLMNSMSSDLVVYVSPPVITSYQEALDRVADGQELKIVFPPQLPESGHFKNAPKDSIESKLWNLRSDIFETKTNGLAMLPKLAGPIVRQELIAILRDSMARAVTAWSLNMVHDGKVYEEFKAVLNIDGQGYTNAIVMAKWLDERLKNIVRRVVKRMTTGGIQEKAFDDLAKKMSLGKSDFILEDRTSKLVKPQDEIVLPYLKLLNMKYFWMIIISMMLLILIVFGIEHIKFRCKGAKPVIKVKVVNKYGTERPKTSKFVPGKKTTIKTSRKCSSAQTRNEAKVLSCSCSYYGE